MKLTTICKLVSCVELTLGILCIAYYFLCVYRAGSGVSVLYIWIIMGSLLVLKGSANIWIFRTKIRWLRILSGSLDAVGAAILLSVLLFAGFVIRGMNDYAKAGCDYVIVLGAGVNGSRPSEILQRRIDAAFVYLEANPDAKVIGTGGQGIGEAVSEGKCIANELQAMGISADRILYEEKSTTTVENMKFALEVMPDRPHRIAVVSNGFHISRSKLILSNYTNAQIYGIAATGGGLLTPHYILREYVVFLVDLFMGNYTGVTTY